MSTTTTRLPKRYHDAVVKWRETYLTDYDFLLENWDRHFPKDPQFQLCAYRELGMCNEIECGDHKGRTKYAKATEIPEKAAARLLGAIRAQASTEFGSIQQHRLTLARAHEEEEQFWVLRMMAEELRHGYQMLHVLLEDDWSSVSSQSNDEMVEEILSMQTGSHVLGAFNIDFDSFVDNVVFCALVDRVGKYQLAMQKISAYKPMSESMPQMLREEAFHLATGVVPMRRWVEKAARGSVLVTMQDLQLAINKWLPRALEMFGDERGGGSNVRDGFKPQKNADAQGEYYDEIRRLLVDLNMKFIRARLPELDHEAATAVLRSVIEDGAAVDGIGADELLRMPDAAFYRRRGVPAFTMTGIDGSELTDLAAYQSHLVEHLPAAYRAGSDFGDYLATLTEVAADQLSAEEAGRRMPTLRRMAGACPCSNAVRWVAPESPAPVDQTLEPAKVG